MARDPYCGNCGYSLVGLTDSTKCPECGRPIIEVLERGPAFRGGRRYTSPIVLFGLPLVQIALGPHENEKSGKARGIIAIGDQATGWLAIGGFARGIIAFGGFAIGLISFGGMSIGLLALGGWAVGVVAGGGGAVGVVAQAGGAIGVVAQGGGAAGYYVQSGGGVGKYVDSGNRSDAEARQFFARWNALLSAHPRSGLHWVLTVLGWYLAVTLCVAAILATLVLIAYTRRRRIVER